MEMRVISWWKSTDSCRKLVTNEAPIPLHTYSITVTEHLTDLGDLGTILPVAAVFFFILRSSAPRRTVRYWLIFFSLCLGATIVAKTAIIAFDLQIPGLSLVSPSAHVANSIFLYGGIAMLIGFNQQRLPRMISYAIAMAVIVAIAWSRIALHAHSFSEVAVGACIGLAALASFGITLKGLPRAPLPQIALLGLLATVVGCNGLHFDGESRVFELAHLIRRAAGPT
jgi:membrane-associated phospholipid phosphatase